MKPKPKTSVMDKKIVPNPRYKNVENVVDTGNNLRKELERLEEVHQFYKFRNDEVFRRININNLVRLLIEQTKLEYQLNPSPPTNIEQELVDENQSEFADSATEELEFDVGDNHETQDNNEDIRSLIQSQFDEPLVTTNRQSRQQSRQAVAPSVINGVGEMDKEEDGVKEDPSMSRPFLILDVRDQEEYSRSHLVYSQSYPHTRLNRAFDYETKSMLRVKNKAGTVLVVYDNDESQARQTATTLTQRGYDNVFMLSGGLRVASLKYPDTGLVVGEEKVRMEEGDVMCLEQCLEENIRSGELTSVRTGRSRQRQSAVSRFGEGCRTSTALGSKY